MEKRKYYIYQAKGQLKEIYYSLFMDIRAHKLMLIYGTHKVVTFSNNQIDAFTFIDTYTFIRIIQQEVSLLIITFPLRLY